MGIRLLDQRAARAPIGKRVDVRVLFSGGRTFYAALDQDRTITGLELPPLQAEPLDPAADGEPVERGMPLDNQFVQPQSRVPRSLRTSPT